MAQRTWFITGVSSGFGRQLTEQLLARGDRVVGTVRDSGKVADLFERYPDAFRVEVLDVTDTAAMRKVVERSFARDMRIDQVPDPIIQKPNDVISPFLISDGTCEFCRAGEPALMRAWRALGRSQ